MTGATIRRTLALWIAIAALAFASPAFAQSGQIKGKVVDDKGNPVDGATISIQNVDTGTKPMQTKTSKKGEYLQVGLAPGHYKITAGKGDLTVTKDTQIHLDMTNLDFTLSAAESRGNMSKEDAAKAKARGEALQKSFQDGVDLSNQGKTDEAIAKFQEVATAIPNCAECYANIGTVRARAAVNLQDAAARQKQYEDAEAAFKTAIEKKPDFCEAYTGLANVYNAEKKFDLAVEAQKKATDVCAAAAGAAGAGGAGGGGGSASAVFNQGVILWNAGKIPEAKAQFEQATKLDPNLADAHYWLGMALVNAGNTAEAKPHFETYLKLAPTGQYADTAKAIVAQIK
jgi:tetratricopeptide (TPR) repeat protein